MMKLSKAQLLWTAWTVSSISVILALLAWGQGIRWQLSEVTGYQLFPLLGLLAFSLMWAHYVIAALRIRAGIEINATKRYFELTSFAVLICLILHPAILSWKLWQGGFGLPPNSYMEYYVAPSLRWAAFIGAVGLTAFLLFELRRKLANKQWWKYAVAASDLAIIGIFVHGLALGSHVQGGWYQIVWWIYGLTLVGAIGYLYLQKLPEAAAADGRQKASNA